MRPGSLQFAGSWGKTFGLLDQEPHPGNFLALLAVLSCILAVHLPISMQA
jgi:hypothetical protein